eukprot:CAMPEP_0118967424 /NCGR_PEP_ID=MMETSP1173-20130426/4811_1 /TAXON_ID=1034831 /ORGANISM="Rhizochromulina marina cf, Strain CCMP1243" /LENGTH=66 /DNA_ID=CAMNT_0006916387 /DNA_START=188 /DNA_END=388 /DNA_ORIENTATION=-
MRFSASSERDVIPKVRSYTRRVSRVMAYGACLSFPSEEDGCAPKRRMKITTPTLHMSASTPYGSPE